MYEIWESGRASNDGIWGWQGIVEALLVPPENMESTNQSYDILGEFTNQRYRIS